MATIILLMILYRYTFIYNSINTLEKKISVDYLQSTNIFR